MAFVIQSFLNMVIGIWKRSLKTRGKLFVSGGFLQVTQFSIGS